MQKPQGTNHLSTCITSNYAPAGKSFLLNRIIQHFREEYRDDFNASVAVTAATGIAATHISGTTLHSQTGCGVPQTIDDFDRMWKPQSRERWRKMKVHTIIKQKRKETQVR